MQPARAQRAALLVAVGIAASSTTCSVAARLSEPLRMALWAMGVELLIGLTALGLAALSPAPLGLRLGLVRGRLTGPRLGLLVIATLALSQALDGALQLSGLREGSVLSELDARLHGARGAELAAALLGLGLAPGIAEELLCRGLVQRALVPRLGAAAGIGIATLFFAILHWDPVHAPTAAVLGLHLGVVAWLTGSVSAAIACHVANNAVAVLSAAWAPEWAPGGWAAVTAGLAVEAGVLAWLWRRAGPPPRGEPGRPTAQLHGSSQSGIPPRPPSGSDAAQERYSPGPNRSNP